MTHETEMKVKMELYARCRANAVATLSGIAGHPVSDDKDAVMLALEHAFRHGGAEKCATAVCAFVQWKWACLEQHEGDELSRVGALMESEAKPPAKA